MDYKDLDFKIPIESSTYIEDSDFVVAQIESIISDAVKNKKNKITINTNLKYGLPMENINKIAGPIIEAWAFEIFETIKSDTGNIYSLINAETCSRLNMADIILQFAKRDSAISAYLDSKSTSDDIPNSGKGPNITSFSRIRTAYISDPDYMFIILSLKHKVYSLKNEETQYIDGVMEVVKHNAYDLKLISAKDISYNPALGTGQIQLKDIHYIDRQERTTWEFCQLLDKKYLASSRRALEDWLREAKKYKWIK
ncbi:MAG: restriction endonuclease [Firmicutes bacterium]|nr:restriction endonuclease [Bacillota bacterium]